ncbi:MAG: hydrolase TatD [Chloroflexi bacterium]|nr:MAG: hydrolase TatD [Chloroflexota bacterium]PIE82078.1 MAG: hydrolase TatD [Chloroflexota bacterium]
MLVDTHCHLDLNAFDNDRDEIVARATEHGVTRIIVPAIDLGNCEAVLQLTAQYDGVFAAVGIHPNATAVLPSHWLEIIKNYAQQPKVVAVGEIGLDYYWDDSPPEVQHEAWRQQLALAAELDLPVIIHNREASADVIRLLAESPLAGRERPGVLHSFSADWATAQAALDMGFYLGFTGPVTFKKAEELREIVAKVPLDKILVETDAPYLTPHPYRGKRNEPGYVRFVAQKIAAVRGMETAVLAAQTTANAERLFKIGRGAT